VTASGFTAPVSGYYLFLPGQPPRLLTEEEAAMPFAEVADRYGRPLHLWEGDRLMNSGGSIADESTGPVLTMDWKYG
jgi:hypothetical protein